jgi:uncharacterized protein YigE (DUF2233 family)
MINFLLIAVVFLSHLPKSDCYSYVVGKDQEVKLYWKDKNGDLYRRLDNIPNAIFATNGGMYMEDYSPVGLYIENGKTIKPINKGKGSGNFCIQPNGVFYITNNNEYGVCVTNDFKEKGIKYATQSGPMLVIDGKISPAVQPMKKSLNVRNGVGILPSGEVIFAISKNEISMSDFAKFFLEYGCVNALYLDGSISQMYPYKTESEQNFGVIIGVTKK